MVWGDSDYLPVTECSEEFYFSVSHQLPTIAFLSIINLLQNYIIYFLLIYSYI